MSFPLMIAFLVFLCLSPVAVLASRLPLFHVQDIPLLGPAPSDVKVPVHLGVMSRCPDALLCESIFDNVVETVQSKADLSFVYVGSINSSEPIFGASCKHGPQECAGNVQQLCVKKHVPWANWWGFVKCQNVQSPKIGLPEVTLQCAKAAGIDWQGSGAGHCAGLDGSGTAEEGIALLKQSIALGHKLGIEKSCTILINRRKVCVHDGTWKECENGHQPADFVRQIEEEYQRLNRN